jgi:hypothetical protein
LIEAQTLDLRHEVPALLCPLLARLARPLGDVLLAVLGDVGHLHRLWNVRHEILIPKTRTCFTVH